MKTLTKFTLVTIGVLVASWLYFEFIVSRPSNNFLSVISTPIFICGVLLYIFWTSSIVIKVLKLDGKQTNENENKQ